MDRFSRLRGPTIALTLARTLAIARRDGHGWQNRLPPALLGQPDRVASLTAAEVEVPAWTKFTHLRDQEAVRTCAHTSSEVAYF